VNRKRVHRLYRLEGLSLRRKRPRRHVTAARRLERATAAGPNEQWSMDFVSDALFDGRPFRALAVVDCHSRECLAIVPRVSFRAYQVVEVLDRLVRERGKPKRVFCDNGPEFAGRMLDQWAHLNGVKINFSRPGRPTDNAHIEAFKVISRVVV